MFWRDVCVLVPFSHDGPPAEGRALDVQRGRPLLGGRRRLPAPLARAPHGAALHEDLQAGDGTGADQESGREKKEGLGRAPRLVCALKLGSEGN